MASARPAILISLIEIFWHAIGAEIEQFFWSGASFQGPGPLPMASAHRAIGSPLIKSFWRAIGVEIRQFL